MDRLFRVDFYPQEWLVDTAKLPPDERGLYIQVVALIYAGRGPIIYDAAWIAGLSGCSVRMCKALVDKLVDKRFLSLENGHLSQKRAVRELAEKQYHLQNSSKGGRKQAENSLETSREHRETSVKHPRKPHETNPDLFNNNNLLPSDTPQSLPAPSRTPYPKENINSDLTLSPSARSFNNSSGGYRVERLLDAAALGAAKKAAPGWDIYELMRRYDKNINDGSHTKPDNPSAAFPKWCGIYTKDKTP